MVEADTDTSYFSQLIYKGIGIGHWGFGIGHWKDRSSLSRLSRCLVSRSQSKTENALWADWRLASIIKVGQDVGTSEGSPDCANSPVLGGCIAVFN